MNNEINVVALVRGNEQYIFMFDEGNRTETLRTLGRYAADPELSFTWYDAAILSQRVRELLPAKSIAGNTSTLSSEASQSTDPNPRFKSNRRFDIPTR